MFAPQVAVELPEQVGKSYWGDYLISNSYFLFLVLTDIFQVDRYRSVLFVTTQTDNEETFEKCSFLFEFKESGNFNHRNTLSISRIKI